MIFCLRIIHDSNYRLLPSSSCAFSTCLQYLIMRIDIRSKYVYEKKAKYNIQKKKEQMFANIIQLTKKIELYKIIIK